MEMEVRLVNKFWNWVRNLDGGRTLYLYGTIAEESWFDDEITPEAFRSELMAGTGDVTVWINSPGAIVWRLRRFIVCSWIIGARLR